MSTCLVSPESLLQDIRLDCLSIPERLTHPPWAQSIFSVSNVPLPSTLDRVLSTEEIEAAKRAGSQTHCPLPRGLEWTARISRTHCSGLR